MSVFSILLKRAEDAEARVQELVEENKRLSNIVDQVDDELIVNWIGVKDDNYRQALADLVMWEIQIHNDPRVSKKASDQRDILLGVVQGLKEVKGILDNEPVLDGLQVQTPNFDDDEPWPF
jgi:hypothetical protein